jgi:hypothetical protein
MAVGEKTGLDGRHLVHCSRLSAKVDNTAIQDGFQLYLHNFIVSSEGQWVVVQQGMREGSGTARRYHWHSSNLRSFVEQPHTGICGQHQGIILNMTDKGAAPARDAIMTIAQQSPDHILQDIRLTMPAHHDVRAADVDLKRLGSILWLAQEHAPTNFEELLLLQGLGPRTLQSLALVSEVIHGAPARFSDPARFSFAHGGKDGHPFPVPTRVYDETIFTLQKAVQSARLGHTDKQQAIKKLSEMAQQAEQDFIPNTHFDQLVEKERNESWQYGGRTVFGKATAPEKLSKDIQLRLF